LTFNGPKPSNRHTVNHKDGNKLNNIPENLEWATNHEQMIHAHKMSQFSPRGVNHPFSKYSDDEIRLIRELYQSGMGYHKIKNHFDNRSSWVTIQKIITGKIYRHVI
jgi:hypothetical protein